MQRKEALDKYKWDFSHLYKGDEEWKEDLNLLVLKSKEYKSFKEKLNQKDIFFRYLDLDKEIDIIVNKMVVYLHLGDTDQSDQRFKELEGLLMNEYQKIGIETAFIAPELKEVGFEVISSWFDQNLEYKIYEYGMKKFFNEAKHILSSHDEEILSKISRSFGSIGEMYDTLAYADRREEKIFYKGKEEVMTSSLMSEISQDSDPIADQQLRIDAGKVFSKNFFDHKNSFAQIYEGIIQSSVDSIRLRNYDSCLSSSLSGDSIDQEIYLKLLEAGKNNLQPLRDYTLLIKETLKMEKFYPSDRQLKLVKEYNKTFSVDQAKGIIRNALSIMGSEYLANLEVAWSNNRIDFYEDVNKRDGAYSTGGNGVDPIILMNWDDKLNSVNTLAHEIGHSVHTIFAEQNQAYPSSQYPIILAEIASTINEHLLFDYMFENSQTKEEKIYLLQQRIFDLVSTFYRQIQFADFEYQAHKMVENDQVLTADALSDLFSKVQNEYGYDVFDKLDTTEPSKNYGWPRISHFFHSPFYVYKYAIDVTASFKLYSDIKKGNVQTTLDFLKAGGHKEPMKIIFEAGIDFTKTNTYQPLIDGIQIYVDQLKELLKNS